MASDDEGARREQLRHQFRAQPVHESHAWEGGSRPDSPSPSSRRCIRCAAWSDTGAGVQPCPRDPIPHVARALREHAPADLTGEMEAAGYPPADPTPPARAVADLALEQRHEEGLSLLEQRHAAEPPPVRPAPPTRNGEGRPQRRESPRLTGFLFTSETLLDSMLVAEAEERAKTALHVGDLTLANAARHFAQELRRHIEESGFVSPFLPHEQGG